MKNVALPEKLSQLIVDGILKGYKDYLNVRKRAKQETKISAAYAWVKGNHIDSSVDEMCSNYEDVEISIESRIEKAGYTWEYIQFTLKETDEKFLVIVKNIRGIQKTFNGKVNRVNPDNYLFEYAGINNSLIEKNDIRSITSNQNIQLELSFPEMEAIQKNVALQAPEGYNRFYIVTYEFDQDSKMISKIALTLPNQQEMSLVEVANLTPLIERSEYSIRDDELKTVQTDKIPDSIYAEENQVFGYGIAAENQEEDKKIN
jgi:hypothetical protein